MKTSKPIDVKVAFCHQSPNCRLSTNMNIPPLAEDMSDRGQLTPILVWQKGAPEDYSVLRGHRRLMAAESLGWETIRAEVVTGVTELEAAELLVDHGNVVSLQSYGELLLAAQILYLAGSTEARIASALRGMMDQIIPVESGVKKELASLDQQVAEAETSGKADLLRKQRDARYSEYRRGLTQKLVLFSRLPERVLRARIAWEEGEDGYKITDGDAKKLFAAHSEDLRILDPNGVPIYGRKNEGPAFGKAWAEVITKKGKEKKKITPKAKSRPAIELMKMVSERFKSTVVKTVLTFAAGGPVPDDKMSELDEMCYQWERLEKDFPDDLAQFVKLLMTPAPAPN